MPQHVRDIMTTAPTTLDTRATIQEAARAMRDGDIGDVLLCEGDQLRGMITDRDIAVRAVAEGRDPQTPAAEIASIDLRTVRPGDRLEDAVRIMRQRAIRRLPVVEGGKLVGIISIGDLALDSDTDSALADISAAPGNR